MGVAELLEDGPEHPPGCSRKTFLARVVAAKVLEERALALLVDVRDEHRAALPALLGAEQERAPFDGEFAPTVAPVAVGAPQQALDGLVGRRLESGHDHGQRDTELREEVLVMRRPADDAWPRVVAPRNLVGEAGLRHPHVPLPCSLGRPTDEASSDEGVERVYGVGSIRAGLDDRV